MQDFTNYNPNREGSGAVARAGLGSEALFFQRVYAWMAAGLGLTAVMAVVCASIGVPQMIAGNSAFMIAAFIAQLGLVWYLAARVNQLAPSTAKMLFLGYAALSGVTFSMIVAFYSPTIIFKAFVSTAGVYGAMAIYGLATKRSLSGLGSFLFMGVVGLLIASLVNMFVGSNTADLAICVIGVLIFAGLTAYDHQKLRVMYYSAEQAGVSEDSLARIVVIGALALYLDFINLFLFLLRLFSRE